MPPRRAATKISPARRWPQMVNLYKRAKDECDYKPTYFLQLVTEKGGLAAARQLIRGANATDGFVTLWRYGRLDLSIEAHVLLPEFAPLFSDEERKICRDRLLEYGFDPDRQQLRC